MSKNLKIQTSDKIAKMAKKMLFSYFSNIRNLVFDQNSPVQPISESKGGTVSVPNGQRKSSCLIQDNKKRI